VPLNKNLSSEIISILDNQSRASVEGMKVLAQDMSDENHFHFTFSEGYLKRP